MRDAAAAGGQRQGLASGAVGLGLGLGDGVCVLGGAVLAVYSVGLWRLAALALALAFLRPHLSP